MVNGSFSSGELTAEFFRRPFVGEFSFTLTLPN